MAKQTLEAIQELEGKLSLEADDAQIFLSLENITAQIEALPEKIAEEAVTPAIKDAVDEITERLMDMATNEGYDFSEILGETLDENPTIKAIRNKTEAIEMVVNLLQMLFESKFGGMDTPVVSTFLQQGSVRFRIIAVNPSGFKAQNVPIRIELPIEVKPQNISDLGGLDLEYDTSKSLYYVYSNEVRLKPKETRVFEVTVEDIWVIDKEELDTFGDKIATLAKYFVGSDYEERMNRIVEKSEVLFKEILSSQTDDSVSRAQHIGIYRTNRLSLAALKEEVDEMEKILQQMRGPLTPKLLQKSRFKSDSPTKTATWIAIFVMVLFLALLSAVVFFTWYRQAKATEKVISDAKKRAFPEFQDKEGGGDKKG